MAGAWPYPFFTKEEMTCRCGCGRCVMQADFMLSLIRFRAVLGVPMIVNRGYSCPEHDASIRGNNSTGLHSRGRGIDVHVIYDEARDLVSLALSIRFGGVGICAAGPESARFIHLDNSLFRLWTY